MVLVAILSETGIFDYMAVYAYKVGRSGCGLAPDSVVIHSKHGDSYFSTYTSVVFAFCGIYFCALNDTLWYTVRVISNFRWGVNEVLDFPGRYPGLIITDVSVPAYWTLYQGSNSPGGPWTAWHFKMVRIGSPETSITNQQSTLRNVPEERRPRLKWLPCFHDIKYGDYV
jgi:hypothetical protein